MKGSIIAFLVLCSFSFAAGAEDTSKYCTKAFNKYVWQEGSTYVPTQYPTIYQCCGNGACQFLVMPKPGHCLFTHRSWGFVYDMGPAHGPNTCAAWGQGCAYGNICTIWRDENGKDTPCEGSRYPAPYNSIMRCSNPEP